MFYNQIMASNTFRRNEFIISCGVPASAEVCLELEPFVRDVQKVKVRPRRSRTIKARTKPPPPSFLMKETKENQDINHQKPVTVHRKDEPFDEPKIMIRLKSLVHEKLKNIQENVCVESVECLNNISNVTKCEVNTESLISDISKPVTTSILKAIKDSLRKEKSDGLTCDSTIKLPVTENISPNKNKAGLVQTDSAVLKNITNFSPNKSVKIKDFQTNDSDKQVIYYLPTINSATAESLQEIKVDSNSFTDFKNKSNISSTQSRKISINEDKVQASLLTENSLKIKSTNFQEKSKLRKVNENHENPKVDSNPLTDLKVKSNISSTQNKAISIINEDKAKTSQLTKNTNVLNNKSINLKQNFENENNINQKGQCYNCGIFGHDYQQCTKPKIIFCHGCGWMGKKKADCPYCTHTSS